MEALHEPTKMTRLLQFLKGPALLAMQRYESIPGGLTKALRVLQDHFGQPFKIVRACVDTLVKGPAIAPQDKRDLQRYADTAQVMYDTLEAMNCLGEMNTDNLEKNDSKITLVGASQIQRTLEEARTSRANHAFL